MKTSKTKNNAFHVSTYKHTSSMSCWSNDGRSKVNLNFDDQKVNKLFATSLSKYFLKEAENMSSVFLSSFVINLLAFFHECRSLIDYATHYLFCDRLCDWRSSVCWCFRTFRLSFEWLVERFILKQLDLLLISSMHDTLHVVDLDCTLVNYHAL